DHNQIGTYDDGTGQGNVVCGTDFGIALHGSGVINNALGGFNSVAGNHVGAGARTLVSGNPDYLVTPLLTYSDNGGTQLMGNAIGVVTDSCAHNDLIGGTTDQYHTSQAAGNLISGNIAGGVVFMGGVGGPTDPAEIDGQIAGNTITHNAHAG